MSRATRWASSGSGALVRAVLHQVEAEQQAAAAHVADAVVALLQREQAVACSRSPERAARSVEPVAQDDLDAP